MKANHEGRRGQEHEEIICSVMCALLFYVSNLQKKPNENSSEKHEPLRQHQSIEISHDTEVSRRTAHGLTVHDEKSSQSADSNSRTCRRGKLRFKISSRLGGGGWEMITTLTEPCTLPLSPTCGREIVGIRRRRLFRGVAQRYGRKGWRRRCKIDHRWRRGGGGQRLLPCR